MQNPQANPRVRRRSNLGKRSSVLLNRPQQSQLSINFPVAKNTTGLGRLRSVTKTPSQMNESVQEPSLRKRLFQFKSPTNFTLASDTPTQDITGICSISSSPSPDFHANAGSSGSSSHPSNSKIQTKYFDCLEPPKSPVLSHKFTFSQNCYEDLKPPVDPEELFTFKEPSYRNERILKNCDSDLKNERILNSCGSDLKSLKIYEESKSNSPIENKFDAHKEERHPGSNHQLKIGHPLIETSCLSPWEPQLKKPLFKKPESILQVLKSSEKLSVVNEVESESLDDSFILAEQTIDGNLTIVGDSNLMDDGVKNRNPKASSLASDVLKNNNSKLSKSVLKDSHNLDSYDDIDDVLTYVDNLSERSKEMKRQQILMEKELSQLKQAVQRLKKQKKGKQQLSIENKENDGSESNKKINDAWMKKMKQENPSLLKTPKVRRNSQFSFADQSTIWTPHSLSNILNDQMDELYD